jgi:muconolactone delta-isomerase
MQFLVTGHPLNPQPLPPKESLEAFEATWEIFASGQDQRIKSVYPHADERGATILVDVQSNDELTRLLSGLPAFLLVDFESHPVTTPQVILESIRHTKQYLTE